ncbi:hypothetical protein Sulba_1561 [Sulfurospirillum barnesii SES-3]|uniref:Campylobacter invasion antigen D C-terminal domain-containing protein n=2 Tax=Sulfurospirillum barnesii TaxID=44674 RepID=I3XY25_SULBS|nr:hypothetical protein Sulba_1561 [Sulfurospirillum barnesii SES-3]
MILSTLKELEEVTPKEESKPQTLQPPRQLESESCVSEMTLEINEEISSTTTLSALSIEENSAEERERQFYINLRERILVLFEGFQSPNNKNIEAKIDLTLNFLEYLLATIDEQLEKMETPQK